MKNKKWDLLEIIWLDSMGQESGWRYSRDLGLPDNEMLHYTVGYFLEETRRSVIVAQSQGTAKNLEGDVQVDNVMQIPKVSIEKIRKLR